MDVLVVLAGVSATINLIKKASKTAEDVKSLGPLLGRYFNAKHQANKAINQAKKQGGTSYLGRSIEISLELKKQRDFEVELNRLFFSTNNMDLWQEIKHRAEQLEREDIAETARERDAAKRKKRKDKDDLELFLLLIILVAFIIFMVWGVYESIVFCKAFRCAV